MNKRGWLASGLLAAAVIGGYLGLLPLLSSLAAGPAWPDPVATRDASRVITMTALTPAPDQEGDTATPPADVESDPLVRDAGPTESGAVQPDVVRAKPQKKSSSVTVVVSGGLERVTPKPAISSRPNNGGSGGTPSSGGSSGGSGGGSGASGGSNGGSVAPSTPAPGPLDDIGAGELAGGGGSSDSGEDEASAGG